MTPRANALKTSRAAWKRVDAPEMRNAMGRFVTGVGVLTTADGSALHGMTVNSIASVSLDPPLLLVCLMEDARTTQIVAATRRFNLSILGSENEDVCRRFAEQGADHYRELEYELDPEGIPLLAGAVVQLRCGMKSGHREGDHLIVVANVEYAREPEPGSEPLAYFCGRFYELRAGSKAAPKVQEPAGLFPPTESVEWAWSSSALSW